MSLFNTNMNHCGAQSFADFTTDCNRFGRTGSSLRGRDRSSSSTSSPSSLSCSSSVPHLMRTLRTRESQGNQDSPQVRSQSGFQKLISARRSKQLRMEQAGSYSNRSRCVVYDAGARTNQRGRNVSRCTIKFVQLNMQKSKAPMGVLMDTKFDIALVQEPNINKKDRMNMIQPPNRSFCKGFKPRAGIIFKDDVECWPIEPLSSRDLSVVALVLENRGCVYLASGYLDINKDVVPRELEALVSHCKVDKIPLILGVDSNAHSTLWGEDHSNKRGEDLEEWIIRHNLFIINVGRVPTFQPDNGLKSTIIDLTLTNEWVPVQIQDWRVDLSKASLSDHRIIQYTMDLEKRERTMFARQYKKANWEAFKKCLPTAEVRQHDDVDSLANRITEDLTMALDLAAPKKIVKIQCQNQWWSDSLTLKRKILRNMHFKRMSNDRFLDKYRSLKRELVKEISKAREQSWRDFCSKADSAKDI